MKKPKFNKCVISKWTNLSYIYIYVCVCVCAICAKIMDGVCEIQTKLKVKFQSSKERNWMTQLEDGLIETTLIRS